MLDKSHEYDSLRQELRDHQNSRSATLSLATTVSAALLGAGVQFSNPLLPLLALLLLFFARVQVVQTHSAVQRIASYIRIVLEQDNDELNWETGSYQIRHQSIAPAEDGMQSIPHISPLLLLPIDWFLFACSMVAIVLAGLITVFAPTSSSSVQLSLISPRAVYLGVVGFTTLVWAISWWRYGQKIHELEKMEVDKKEADFWRQFKKEVKKIKAEE